MLSSTKRVILILTGVVALALGAIGVVLPLLPTTPFLLVAAFAFANSSERLHRWLLAHQLFGPLIDNWRRYGAISRRAKIVSVLSMAAILLLSVLAAVPTHVILIQALVLTASAAFILSRPGAPQDESA
jgi:uncharacterized membrane protein YbaN (DUF454 family)